MFYDLTLAYFYYFESELDTESYWVRFDLVECVVIDRFWYHTQTLKYHTAIYSAICWCGNIFSSRPFD